LLNEEANGKKKLFDRDFKISPQIFIMISLREKYWFFRQITLPWNTDFFYSFLWALFHGFNLASDPVFVVGVHRSGTSCVTGILNITGMYVGRKESIFGPDENNVKGYFENKKIVNTNEIIFNHYNTNWEYEHTLPPGWNDSWFARLLRFKIKFILNREFFSQPIWGTKDPRFCITLKFWRRLFPKMRLLVVERDINEIVKSLDRRKDRPKDSFGLVKRQLSLLSDNIKGTDYKIIKFNAVKSRDKEQILSMLDGFNINEDTLEAIFNFII
jgi:hypothetical protein